MYIEIKIIKFRHPRLLLFYVTICNISFCVIELIEMWYIIRKAFPVDFMTSFNFFIAYSCARNALR